MTAEGLVARTAPGVKPGSPPRKDASNPQQGMADPAASVGANTAPTVTNTTCTSPLTVTSLEAAAARGESAAAATADCVPVVVSRVVPVVQPEPVMPVPVDAMLSGPMANLGLTDPAAPQSVLAPTPAAQAEDKKLRFHRTPPTEHDCRKLFVGGLPTDVTDHAFLDYFTQFGQVIDSVVMVDRVTKRSRGFGFVTFVNENDAAKLLLATPGKTGYVMINGKQCEVKASTPKMEDASPKHSHHGSVGMWKSHHNNYRHVNRGYNQRHHNNGHHTGHGKHMFHHHQPHDDKHIYRDDQFVGDVDGRNFDQVYAQQPLTNPSYQAMNAYDRSMNTSNMSMYNHNYQSHYHGAVSPGYGYSGGSTASSVPSSWEASYPAPAQGYGQYPADNMSQGNTGYYTHYDPQYPNQYTGPSYGNNSMSPSMMGHPAYSSYGSFPVADGPAATPGAGTSGFEPYPQPYDGDGNYDQADNQYT